MSITTYIKSLSTDFSGNLNSGQLVTEIETNTEITPVCLTVFNIGDDVRIKFANFLSAKEQTILNTIISIHTPALPIGYTVSNISIPEDIIDSTTYITLTSFNFPGKNLWPHITNIKIISLMESGGTSYDVRVFDITNNNYICSINLSNTDESICDLGALSNIPTGEAIFELHAKINNTSVAHIKNISIYHD